MLKNIVRCVFATTLAISAGPALASFHLWVIDEIYSNADGTVQFIELQTASSGQQFLSGHTLSSSGATTQSFTFPSDLPGDTAGKTFLVGTAGFAALGLVAPDYTVPNGFLSVTNGSVDFAGVDVVSWAALPIDGLNSINHSGAKAINTARNFAGSSATISSVATTSTTASTTTTTLTNNAVLNLGAGWNLVGSGLNAAIDPAATFPDSTKVASVWKWISSTSRWAFYAPSLAGQALIDYATSKGYDVLSSINGGEGFWVNASSAFSAQVPAGSVVTSVSLRSIPIGWNLLGVGETKSPGQFVADLGFGVSSLWAWDAGRAAWYFYAPSLDALGGTALADYIGSKGYLDFAANSKTLGPGLGFWVNRP